MKKAIIIPFLLSGLGLFAQSATNTNRADFELGKGLNFYLNDGEYHFKISGTIQPYYGFQKTGTTDAQHFLNVKRTYFNLSGDGLDKKIFFFFQADFSSTSPLLDAYVSYKPHQNITLSAGQKQSIANNREMLFMENQLAFIDRSLVSSSFSNTGREFGLFAEWKVGLGSFKLVPQAMLTSGDGKNSFGIDTRDVDLGGFKYGGRLDIYPLGFFSEGNEQQIQDFAHEEKPKFVLGGAFSFNKGASDVVGEGHGNFLLYNNLGKNQLPNYRKAFADVLFKFKGISLLVEYGISTASGLQGSFTDQTASIALLPGQISNYLALGRGLNTQLGYVTKSGYGLDVRYNQLSQEFLDAGSIVQNTSAYGVNLAKYMKDNALKVQAGYTMLDQNSTTTHVGQLMFQVIF